MCLIKLQNYIINFWKHVFINTMIYQMQKEKKWGKNYKPKKLFLKIYNNWFQYKVSTDKQGSVDLYEMHH